MSPCRLCSAPLRQVVADLGTTPLANSYLQPHELNKMEPYYPLRALVCEHCWLVQLEAAVAPEAIFSNYKYFSSFSDTLLHHSRAYADLMAQRLSLQRGDRVVEIASNDGYLLRYFVDKGMDVLGIEPAANVAEVARDRGIPTVSRFFGSETARDLVAERPKPSLVVANNVLAHVPGLNDFVAGLKILLAPGGTITLEFHHLLSLIVSDQFDTIYHEHFQYFSLGTARAALATHGLAVVDVDELAMQGGSLRIYAKHANEVDGGESASVRSVLAKEDAAGLQTMACYAAFSDRIRRIKLDLLAFLVGARQAGQSVLCYGAAAKGNTLLNYCGIRADLVEAAVDRSPHKQGLCLPGSRIPIHHPDRVKDVKPDYLLILPWNIRDEIMAQMAHIRDWGGRFVVAVPRLQVLP